MNRRPSGFYSSKAFLGFEQREAEGLSPNTLINYRQHLRLFLEFGGDADESQVTTQDIRAFLAWLCIEYRPKQLSGDQRPSSPETIRDTTTSTPAGSRRPATTLCSTGGGRGGAGCY
jgi:hypothetical protein